MDPMKVLIVDDEMLSRRKIRDLLEDEAYIEIVGECATAADAIESIANEQPDIVFLDIEMPGKNGFAVAETLQKKEIPLLIFVTAFDQYALKAFEVHAFDYLLKPFDSERFGRTMKKAKAQIQQIRNRTLTTGVRDLLDGFRTKSAYTERLVFKNGSRIFFVKVSEVDFIEAEGNYVRVHFGKENHLLREAISTLQSRLDPTKFLRIHRSTIVNVDRIRELHSWFHGEYQVILQTGKQLLLTRSYRENLQTLLGRTP